MLLPDPPSLRPHNAKVRGQLEVALGTGYMWVSLRIGSGGHVCSVVVSSHL